MLAIVARLFSQPMLLGLLSLLPLLTVLFLRSRRRQRKAIAELGYWSAIYRLLPSRSRLAPIKGLLLTVGLLLIIVGSAGPRWGEAQSPVRTVSGGDVVIVLDVSRSMLAEQPSRQERAARALRDLASSFAQRGGPRVALVIFAAQAKAVFPLTVDYDHLRHAVDLIDADDLPPSLRPHSEQGSVSGTRIGAGLRLALQLHDPRKAGHQDIVLLSDGDDPAGDQEYLKGAEEARRRKVPVHVVGLGDPLKEATIPFRGGMLTHNGEPVLTRLNEEPLQEIARRTKGAYIPSHAGNLPLGQLLRDILTGRTADSLEDDETAAVPILKPQYAWFLGAALACLALWLLMGNMRLPTTPRWTAAIPRLAVIPIALGLISAAPSGGVEQLLRQGSDAFASEDYESALKVFEKAEVLASDPGLVAFNKAAALYRLERYREAEFHYERCLEDDQAPAARKARAWFGLGNARLLQKSSRRQLESAIAAYRQCLAMKLEGAAALHADARFNLELARLLWLKTKAAADEESPNTPKNDPNDPKRNKETPKEDPQIKEIANGKGDPDGKDGAAEPGGKEKSEKMSGGALDKLPDADQLVPLSPKETEAHLEQLIARILGERRAYRRYAQTSPSNVKDW